MGSSSFPCSQCGAIVELFGLDLGAVRRKAQRLSASGGTCRACYATKQQRERDEALADAVERLSDLVTVPLDGSERQVAWAETIRAGKLVDVRRSFESGSDESRGDVLDRLCRLSDASWWIERRSAAPAKLMVDVATYES